MCSKSPVSFCQSRALVWDMAKCPDHGAFSNEVCACHRAVSGIVAEEDASCALKRVAYCKLKWEMETMPVLSQNSHMEEQKLGRAEEAEESQWCSEFEQETRKNGAATMNEISGVLVRRSMMKGLQRTQSRFLSTCHRGPMRSSKARESQRIVPS